MKRKLTAGLTGVTVPIFVQDTTSTTGGGLGGLVFNTAGLVAEYRRQGQATWTAITLVAGTLGTWSSGGFIADGALAGAYEVGIPDAAVASGARWVAVRLRSAANMLPVLIEIEIDVVNYQSNTAFVASVPTVVNPVVAGTNLDKTGYAMSANGLDTVTLETGVNVRQGLSLILASAAGVITGQDTNAPVIKGGGVGTTRITATTDNNGNRLTVSLTPPS